MKRDNESSEARSGNSWYCWVLVATLCLVQMVPIVLLYNYTSFFQVPVAEGLGVSYTSFSIGSTFGSLGGMLFGLVLAGKLGRGNIRRWMTTCMLISAVLVFLQVFMDAIWQYWVIRFLISFVFSGVTYIPINTLLDRWFAKSKGLAIGIVYSGAGIGGMILSPLLKQWIDVFGWREAYAIIGCICLVMVIVIFLFVRNSPKDLGILPYGMNENTSKNDEAQTLESSALLEPKGLNRAEALRTASMWLLVLCVFGSGIIASGVSTQLPTYIAETGEDYSIVMVFFSCGMIVSSLVLGPVFDRFGVKTGGTAICIVVLFALLGFLISPAYGVALSCIGAVLISFNCISNFVANILNGKLFGTLDFAGCFGVLNVAYMAGCMAGAPLVAAIRMETGAYDIAWVVLIAITVLMEVTMLASISSGKKLPEHWHE
ncbi:MAG: MFS transporter [Coriobacteriales bacterium]